MEKMPKNKKNLEYHIERMTRNGEDNNRRTEYVVNDWAKQYKRQGDRKAAGRCEDAIKDMARQQGEKEKKKFEW